MTPKKQGGKRAGSGRKKGGGTGRTTRSSSITMTHELWDKLDLVRGGETRSGWISDKVKKARVGNEHICEMMRAKDGTCFVCGEKAKTK